MVTPSEVTLSVHRVGAVYGARRPPVLRDVTLPDLHGGTVVAVVGPNAAGKSTLFRRIAGLLDGEVVTFDEAGAVVATRRFREGKPLDDPAGAPKGGGAAERAGMLAKALKTIKGGK